MSKAWAIEIDDYYRKFLVGIGYSPYMTNGAPDWTKPITTLLFKSRIEAREVLREYKRKNAWCFRGERAWGGKGNRIYRSARVARVSINILVVA